MSGLRRLLRQHGDSRDLLLFLIDGLDQAPDLLCRHLPTGRRCVVADATTAAIAANRLADALGAELIILPPRGEGQVVAGMTEAECLVQQLADGGATAAIAVGSGTLNDLTKFACHRTGIPAAVVATAPSMNGYTSACAALLDGDIKVSLPCPPPRIAVAPVDLLRQAPSRMVAAGFADLRSRPVSGADWYLGHRLLNTPYDRQALHLAHEAETITATAVDGLRTRDPDAIAALTAGLLLSGMAMDIAGTSAPSSGAEHLVSHLLDMRHHACGGPHDLHGCQVGVATLAVARLYERLLNSDLSTIQPPPLAPWEAMSESLKPHFGRLWSAVEPVARQVHGDDDSRRTRRIALGDNWPQILPELRGILGASPASPDSLLRAGAPVCFAEISIDADGARSALLHARFVRTRYTILDLLAELGVLEAWVDDLLADGEM
jgi:glycerol-1-phosphate dehydrogenase [NAD(P)+]